MNVPSTVAEPVTQHDEAAATRAGTRRIVRSSMQSVPAQDWQNTLRQSVRDADVLHVGGAALLCLLLGGVFLGSQYGLGLQGEAFEWALFGCMGLLFPVAILGLSLATRRSRGGLSRYVAAVRLALAGFFVVASLYLLNARGEQRWDTYGIVAALVIAQLRASRGNSCPMWPGPRQ